MFEKCTICPRNCSVDREHGEGGFCGASARLKVARIGLHFWEEPPISGSHGSGAIFFSGCNLKCCFCQNYQLSHMGFGKEITVECLAEKFLELEQKKAHNINLVTGSHYVPGICAAIKLARKSGLTIPVVYNTSSYEKVETLKQLEGLVDVYLPDLKFYSAEEGLQLAGAPDYFEVASKAILEMLRQTGPVCIDEQGLINSGVIVRHLVLPGRFSDSLKCLEWFATYLRGKAYLSLMAQYVPAGIANANQGLKRILTEIEYETVVSKLDELNIEEGFVQEMESASTEYIPEFDNSGVD